MKRVRTGWLERRLDRRSAPAPNTEVPIRPTTLDQSIDACAAHSGKLVYNRDRKRAELGEALRQLLVVHARSAAGSASRAGRGSGWAKECPELLDALLEAGNKALYCWSVAELELALSITDAVLTERPNSRAGWRLRARVLEEQGEDAGAAEAHERYVALCRDDDLGIAARVTGLRQSATRLAELLGLLREEFPKASGFVGGEPAELWAEGLALDERGEWPQAAPRLVAALSTMHEQGASSTDMGEALAGFMDRYTTRRPDGVVGSGAVLRAYADHARLRSRGPVADWDGGASIITVGDFRNLIAGKSICLVANSQRVGSSSMGEEIDSYDLVVRFNSFRIDAPATGSRTDIHATIHKHGFNWGEKVQTRLVFGGLEEQWKQSIRQRLVPGAQRYLNDASLRWPLRNLGRVSEEEWPSIPTSGFNMLWLLDFLDVNPTIDLIGFDFYDSGAYRLPGAMKLPITSVHEYLSEKAWVMDRATSRTEKRISLR
ncbi:glycosyltransferase family 29 protein [Streptomyces sp. JJ38]|uniref:glycosyltransferase family 29 protein n=1 Tax=Streptomyces sp. JJ38 TaxID=2738128 RepID=UPI001C58CD60|nr:glycosyltransferase family 29 protein [Streptomyces sp. JJ38]MBW1595786.1 hypothetical protein [Streptomyces sp. JJ38]